MSDEDATTTMRVVVSTPEGIRREIIEKVPHTKNAEGQITLPAGYYSAAYWERLTDGNWMDLPWLTTPRRISPG